MRDVRIEKERLKAAIQKNREQHHEQYEKAFAGYVREMHRTLDEIATAFRRDPHAIVIQRLAVVTIPEDHTKDYDVILDMLDMSADDHIVLDQASYRQYVRDEWGWKQQWTASNSKYM